MTGAHAVSTLHSHTHVITSKDSTRLHVFLSVTKYEGDQKGSKKVNGQCANESCGPVVMSTLECCESEK